VHRSPIRAALALALASAPAVAAPSPEVAREAQALSDQAREHYQAGRFEEAVAAYLAAFDRIEEPLLLKNAIKVLAVHIGDCDQTVRLGDDYLATGPERGRA
jgi:tetratricopeptide (TPR) repeat protein